MALQTTRRRTWTGIALASGVLGVGAAAWSLHQWAPFADEASAVHWPANVRPLAEFVQETTRQRFIEPISVEYIGDPAAYAARVAPESDELTDEDRAEAGADAAIDEGVGRALGLWEGDVSLLSIRAAYAGVAPFPVDWLPDERTIVVHAAGSTAELPPLLRAELVLRLTQALDDQSFDTVEMATEAASSQDYQAVIALTLGHAIWVQDRYLDGFSDDDVEEYYAEYDEQGAAFAQAVAEAPIAYRAIRVVSQQLGPMFVEALSEQGRQLLGQAFTDVPAALDQVSLPVGKYLRRDALEPAAPPPGPLAGEVKYTNQMGPFGLYLLLSTGLPAADALTASDGWGNDRYTVYRLDGRTCVDVLIVADSRSDADRLEAGLAAWALARPDEADALVGRDGTNLYASACDPGTAARQPVPSKAAIDHYLGRASEIRARSDYSGDPALAECIAISFYALRSFDTDDDQGAEMDAIESDCLATA